MDEMSRRIAKELASLVAELADVGCEYDDGSCTDVWDSDTCDSCKARMLYEMTEAL